MKYLDELAIGYTFETPGRTIFDADIIGFAGLSGDFTPLHVNDVYAASTPFGRRIAHGMLIASIATGLRCEIDDWAIVAFLENSIRFKKAVFPGDTIMVRYEIQAIRPSASKPKIGVVTLAVAVLNQSSEVVQEGTNVLLVERAKA